MILATATPAAAQFTWSNASGGVWNLGTNWVGGTIPTSGPTTSLTFNGAASPYTATNDIGPFDLNALTFNNDGTVTLAGSTLNFTGTSPTVTIAGNGTYNVSAPVTLSANLTVNGSGTGGFTISGAIAGGTNNLTQLSAGSLTLSGGGTLNQLSVQSGSAFITGGTLNLTMPTDTENTTAGLQLGAASGQTVTTTISGGATVNVFENAYIGDAAGSAGTLTVTGTGTVLNIGTPGNAGATSGRFGVGNFGTGTLNILAGGVVNVDNLFGSRQAGSSGTILVDGSGSTLHVTTIASVGNNANGSLTIQNGGKLQADLFLVLGNNGAGQTGTITVTGSASTLTVGTPTTSGELDLGLDVNTTNNFNVLAGATTTVNGNLFTSIVDTSNTTITVSGSNSLLHTTGQLVLSGGAGIAGAGSTTVNITSGGKLQVDDASFIGADPGGNTSITISGTGSSFVTGQVVIDNGPNTFTVQNGGSFSSSDNVLIGVTAGTSTVTVTGTGSTFTVAGGAAGGIDANGIFLGVAGTATLTVADGGSVSTPNSLFVFSGGTVNINAGGLLSVGALGDGDVSNTGTVNIAAGTTLSITAGDPLWQFNGVIAGAGSVTKSGSDIQTFGGVNTYSGGTIITGGTLLITNASSLGTGNIAVGSGATLSAADGITVTVPAGKTLSGSGTVAAPLTVNGTVAPGGAPGTGPGILTVSGNTVTFTSGSTFAVTLNGTTAGTGYSRLVLSDTIPSLTLGNATLTGTLGYTPANADKLFILVLSDAAGTISGTFNGIAQDGVVTIGGYQAQVSYTGDSASGLLIGGNDVVLYNFTPVPEPSSLLVVGAGLVGLRRMRRR